MVVPKPTPETSVWSSVTLYRYCFLVTDIVRIIAAQRPDVSSATPVSSAFPHTELESKYR